MSRAVFVARFTVMDEKAIAVSTASIVPDENSNDSDFKSDSHPKCARVSGGRSSEERFPCRD